MAQLFKLTMETGDLSQFTSTTTGSGNTLEASATAAKEGSYGLRVDVNGNTNATFGQKDDSGLSVPVFRAGWWFKMDSYTGGSGTQRLFEWRDLGSFNGQVQWSFDGLGLHLRLVVEDDSHSNVYSGMPPMPDWNNWHYYEVRLVRASSTSASDGEAYLLIDGWPIVSIQDLDLYDTWHTPNQFIWGLSGIGGTLTGEVFYDDMEVDSDETNPLYAKAEPFTSRVADNPSSYQAAGLCEGGSVGSGGSIDNDVTSALNGTSGGIHIDAGASSAGDPRAFIAYDTTAAAGRLGHVIDFYMDASNLTMGENDDFDMLRVISDHYYRQMFIELEEYDATYNEIRFNLYDDSNTNNSTSQYQITVADEHRITVVITYATSTSASDGEAKFYVDGVLKETLSNLDYYDADGRPSTWAFGFYSGAASIQDSLYIDEINLRHDNTDPFEGGGIVPQAAITYHRRRVQ